MKYDHVILHIDQSCLEVSDCRVLWAVVQKAGVGGLVEGSWIQTSCFTFSDRSDTAALYDKS